MEFIALANHRKEIAVEIAEQVAESRQAQLEALQRLTGTAGVVGDDLSPEAMLVLIASVSRTIALEESLGLERGPRGRPPSSSNGSSPASTIVVLVDDCDARTPWPLPGNRSPDQGWAIVAPLRHRSARRWP